MDTPFDLYHRFHVTAEYEARWRLIEMTMTSAAGPIKHGHLRYPRDPAISSAIKLATEWGRASGAPCPAHWAP